VVRSSVPKASSLNPGGDHPPQQVRREVFRGWAPEHRNLKVGTVLVRDYQGRSLQRAIP
jgi:hypothetical protein